MRLHSIIRDINDNGKINSPLPRLALLCNKMTAQDDCLATIPLHRNLKSGKYNATEKAEEFNNPDAISIRSRVFLLIKERAPLNVFLNERRRRRRRRRSVSPLLSYLPVQSRPFRMCKMQPVKVSSGA